MFGTLAGIGAYEVVPPPAKPDLPLIPMKPRKSDVQAMNEMARRFERAISDLSLARAIGRMGA